MRVDVILLTYNRADLISRSIKSILGQTYKNIRLIISDDYSTDNTENVIKSFNDKRIVYHKNKSNLGFLNNWKQAASYVTSNFFIPIFSDDDYLVDMHFIEDSMNYLLEDKELDMVMYKHSTLYNNTIINYNLLSIKNYCTGMDVVKDYNTYLQYISIGIFRSKFTKFISDSVFNLDDTTTSNEYVIYFDIFLHAKGVRFIDKVAYYWTREDVANLSNKNNENLYYAIKNNLSIAEHLYPYLEKQDINFNYVEMFNKHLLYSFEEVSMNYYLSRDNIFTNLLNDINSNDILYIYGKGEVGIKLKIFLDKNNIRINSFIDDIRLDNDVIKLSSLVNNKKDKTIIIASYKNSQIISIMKKIISSKININNILTLIN